MLDLSDKSLVYGSVNWKMSNQRKSDNAKKKQGWFTREVELTDMVKVVYCCTKMLFITFQNQNSVSKYSGTCIGQLYVSNWT